MMVIVNFLHYSVSRPSILFVGLVLFAPIITSPHIVPKLFSQLVYCFGEIACYTVMVKSTGPHMIPSVELGFSFLCFLM